MLSENSPELERPRRFETVTLSSGSRLGPYEILSPLGAEDRRDHVLLVRKLPRRLQAT
jgi:hypothetical protein